MRILQVAFLLLFNHVKLCNICVESATICSSLEQLAVAYNHWLQTIFICSVTGVLAQLMVFYCY